MSYMVKVSGGDKLKEFIKKAQEQKAQLNVGFLTETTAKVAIIQEYGAHITVTEKMRKWFMREGLQIKKSNPKADISMYFVKVGKVITIPARAFMKKTKTTYSKGWSEFLIKLINSQEIAKDPNNLNVEDLLNTLGERIEDQIQATIADGGFTPNAAFTIARKGKDTPLHDTGKMKQDIAHEVIRK